MTSFMYWSFWVILVLQSIRCGFKIVQAINEPSQQNAANGIVSVLWGVLYIHLMHGLYNIYSLVE